MALKRCSRCKENFPATTEYFHRNKSTHDGLHFYHKECARTYVKDYMKNGPRYEAGTDPQVSKICSDCGETKPATSDYFHRNRRNKSGLGERCCVCDNKRVAAYLAKKPKIKSVTNAYKKDNYAARRTRILTHYSNGVPQCACCGERRLEFLAIDHINGGGVAHRADTSDKGKGPGSYQYWFIRNNFPPGFRVLCHNCNCARGFYGECPHEKEREAAKTG